jgi:hypothetical protein
LRKSISHLLAGGLRLNDSQSGMEKDKKSAKVGVIQDSNGVEISFNTEAVWRGEADTEVKSNNPLESRGVSRANFA